MSEQTAPDLPAVCDAGPLIHLDEIGYAGLLAGFSPLLAPERVMLEARTFRLPEGLPLKVVSVSDSARAALLPRLTTRLDPGEIDALALNRMYPSAVFLTDDLRARAEAKNLGLRVHGSVGIIVRASRTNLLSCDQADKALSLLASCQTLFVSSAVIDIGREQLRQGRDPGILNPDTKR